MNLKDVIDESEKIKAEFKYVGWTKKIKILGATNKRAYVYKKSHNDYKIVTSHKAISQIEYGHYRLPIWIWFMVFISFFFNLMTMFEGPTPLDWFFFIPSCGAVAVTIIYRKFDFINTAVGCEPFRVLSIRGSIIDKIEDFINILHSKPTELRNTPDEYVQSNYYELLFKRLLSIISILYSPLPLILDLLLLGI